MFAFAFRQPARPPRASVPVSRPDVVALASVSPEARLLEAHGGDRYRVVRELGRGGMGVIFLVEDLMLGRAVAVKVLRVELAESSAQRERFRNEARALATLDHPGIVALHAFHEDGPLACMIMQYVEGETLGARLERERYLDGAAVTHIVAALAEAVEHAHAAGLVHRDLKPENVLLTAQGSPVLIDFGVALTRGEGRSLELGRAVGTPHYMSPEQAAGDANLDGRSDVYSLGVLAYHLLSGQLPFDGETFGAIAAQHVVKEAAPLRRIAPHVPAHLAAIVERCLLKQRGDRWPSAGALAHALRTSATGSLRRGQLRHRGAVEHLAVGVEAGAVAGAIPRLLR